MNVQRSCVVALERDPDLAALLAEYAAESAIAGLPPPAARIDSYRELEERGLLHVLSATHEGRLIGFLTLLAPVLPHYGVTVAVSESFFVSRAHRRTGAGLKLLRAAEELAYDVGAPGLLVSAPFEGDLFKVLPRVGYAESSRVFFKRVGNEGRLSRATSYCADGRRNDRARAAARDPRLGTPADIDQHRSCLPRRPLLPDRPGTGRCDDHGGPDQDSDGTDREWARNRVCRRRAPGIARLHRPPGQRRPQAGLSRARRHPFDDDLRHFGVRRRRRRAGIHRRTGQTHDTQGDHDMSGMSTATILSLGLSAVGTAAGFAGQLQQQQARQQAAVAAAAQAVYQSQVARQNEEVMRRRADAALEQGRAAEESSRRLTSQRIGSQTARLAAEGTDLEGSPTDILGDTAAAGEVDALALRAKAARASYDYQAAAVGYGNTGVLETTRALNTTYSPDYLGAGGSLLSSASSLADRWRNFQKGRTGPDVHIVHTSAAFQAFLN